MIYEKQLDPPEEFLLAIAKSLRVLHQIMGAQVYSIHLLDSHVQPSREGLDFVEADHCAPCLSIPITLQELSLAKKVVVSEDFKVEIAAYVAIMATGGVEWNTITILTLQEKQGLVVSRIKPDMSSGDLNRVALENGLPIFCNFGCEGQSSLPFTDSILKLNPFVFWICNWSVQDELETAAYSELGKAVSIVDQRSYDTKEGWIQTVDQDVNRYVRHFVATNGLIENEILARIGRNDRPKVSTIRPVLRSSPEYSQNPPLKKDLYQISRLSPQKRIDRGLRMSGWLSEFGYEENWNIVGDGPLRENLKVQGLKHTNAVFHGFKPTLEIINSAYGLVQSSDFEGLPMVVIEALAAGIPVFSTSTGDLPWLKEQLSSIDCALLTLSEFQNEDELKLNFLNWRKNLSSVWSSSDRFEVSEEVKRIFNPVLAAERYSEVFSKGITK
jgi:glycosyltransferase involved in cell wall biosynthesis